MDDLTMLIQDAMSRIPAHAQVNPVTEQSNPKDFMVRVAMDWYEGLGELTCNLLRGHYNLKSSSIITTFYWKQRNEYPDKPDRRKGKQRHYRKRRPATMASSGGLEALS